VGRIRQTTYLLLLIAAGAVVGQARAQADGESAPSREYAVKAAYLYNFGRYVRWPDTAFRGAQDPFVIGVLGSDPFGSLLETIAGEKQIEGRKILLRRFASLDKYTPCHILFVSRSLSAKQQAEAVERLKGSGVLLVGETAAFGERGGTVRFTIEEDKVRFTINQEAAKREDLKISSKLLSLARPLGGER